MNHNYYRWQTLPCCQAGYNLQSKWEAHSDAPLRVRSPNYTAAVNLAVIVVIPPDSAVPMAPVAPVPNAAATAPMIQAATIMYSNDTTPSWSLAKVFTLFRNLRMLNASKLMLSFKIQFQWCGSSPDHHGVNFVLKPGLGQCFAYFYRSEEHTSELQSQSNLV